MQRGATQNVEVFLRTADLFRQAIAHDPTYPAPYAALAMALAQNHYNQWDGDPEASLVEAEKLAYEAIERDPTEPFGHGVAALVAKYQQNFEQCAVEADKALALNPNFAPALSLRASVNLYSGNALAAIHDLERAIRLDPYFTHGYLHHLGVAHLIAGDDEMSAAILRERVLLVPETDMSRAYLSAALANLGQLVEARRVWEELMIINRDYSFGSQCLSGTRKTSRE